MTIHVPSHDSMNPMIEYHPGTGACLAAFAATVELELRPSRGALGLDVTTHPTSKSSSAMGRSIANPRRNDWSCAIAT
jgi:hypothetical protein